MMQASQDRERYHRASLAIRTSREDGLFWTPLLNTLMWARLVEVGDILLEYAMEVPFTQDQDVVEAFAPDAAQQSFADRVRTWCLDRRSEYLDPGADCDGFEV